MSLGLLIVRMGLDATDFVQGTSRAEAEANRFAKSINNSIVGAAAKFYLVTDAIKIVGNAFSVISDQVEAIANFQNLAEKIGDTAENLASIKKASDVSGVAMDTIATASVKLTTALSKTGEDGTGAAHAIKQLGLDFDSFKKLAPVDQIDAVSKSMAGFKDGAGKTEIAVRLWGKSGADMIPLLNDLANGSERQITLTNDQIKAADDFSKSMAQLKSDFQTFLSQTIAPLLPVLQDIVKAFTDTGDNAQNAGGKVSGFGGAMQSNIQLLKDTVIELLYIGEWYVKLTSLATGYANVSSALLSGNLTQAKEIGAAFRVEFDKTSQEYEALRAKIRGAGKTQAPKQGGFKPSDNYGDTKPDLPTPGKTGGGKTGGAPKVSEADRYLESLQKQLLTTQDLTTAEKVWTEIQSGRLGSLTEMQKLNLQLAAAAIDQQKQKEAADKLANDLKLQNDKDSAAFDAAKKAEGRAAYEAEKRLIQEQQTLGENLRKSVMTDQEEINALADQYAQYLDKQIIDLETYSRLMDGLETKTDANTSAFINFEATAQQAASSLADGLTDAIMQGKSLGDVFKNVVKQLAAMILKALLFKALQVGLNAVSPGLGDLAVGAAPKGAKAGGGSVNAGSTYLVGEKGAELFTPTQSGKITTNAQTFKDQPIGRMGTSNVYNIAAPGVSREEFMSGLNRTQAGAVSNVRDNKMRRRA